MVTSKSNNNFKFIFQLVQKSKRTISSKDINYKFSAKIFLTDNHILSSVKDQRKQFINPAEEEYMFYSGYCIC